jgi:hypothetical protein
MTRRNRQRSAACIPALGLNGRTDGTRQRRPPMVGGKGRKAWLPGRDFLGGVWLGMLGGQFEIASVLFSTELAANRGPNGSLVLEE